MSLVLFDLIKSLSNEEKRLFKLNTKKNGEYSKYYNLFVLLDKQPFYNEKTLLEQINDPFLKKNFSRFKNYLYRQLLEIIEKSNASITATFFRSINTADALFTRGLYEAALEIINDLKKDERLMSSQKFDLFTILYDRELKIKGSVEVSTGKILSQEGDFNNVLNSIDKQQKLLLYSKDNIRIYRSFEKPFEEGEKLRETILTSKLYKNSEHFSAMCELFYYHNFLLGYHRTSSKKSEMIAALTNCLTLLKREKTIIIENEGIPSFFNAINSTASLINLFNEQRLLPKLFELINEIRDFSKNEMEKAFAAALGVHLQYQLLEKGSHNNANEIIAFVGQVQKDILKLNLKKFPRKYWECMMVSFNACFKLNKYNQAQQFIYEILKIKNIFTIKELLWLRIIELIVLVEMRLDLLFESKYRSLIRLLEANEYSLNKSQTIILKNLKKILKTNSADGKKELFKQLKAGVNLMELPQKGTNCYFEYNYWIESKLNSA